MDGIHFCERIIMKPFDLSKFRKSITKSLGIVEGFYDPHTWLDTGNYALNYRVSNDFFKGIPLDGKVTMFAGESGAAKSLIVCGNIVKYCQQHDVVTVIMDSEGAVERDWVRALGVNPDLDNISRLPVSTPNDCIAAIQALVKDYDEQTVGIEYKDLPPVLLIIDSLGMLSSETEKEQAEKGEMKGDKGIMAKQLKSLVKQCIRLFSGRQIGLIATNHTYKSQSMFEIDDTISGGGGFIFAASVVILMNKYKLKEDEDGNKTTNVRGIRSKMKVMKSRYAKPFEEVEIHIPWDGGMDRYSGLVDMFEKANVLTKEGNKLKYTDKSGAVHKYFRKDIPDSLLDQIMKEWEDSPVENGGVDETPKELIEND